MTTAPAFPDPRTFSRWRRMMQLFSGAHRAAARCASVALVVVLACVALGSGGVASAHNVDELSQQVYVTPTMQGLAIGLEMTPGSQIAPGLLALIDTDDDQVISAVEAAAHAESVRSSLTVMLDGQPILVRLARSTYPEVPITLAGGGTIIIEFTADIPTTQHVRTVRVTNGYAPMVGTVALLTKVQANLTPDTAVPVAVESTTHEDDGRTLGARFSVVKFTPPVATSVTTTVSSGAAPLSATGTKHSRSPFIFGAIAVVLVVSGLLISSRRRNAVSA